MSGTMRLSTQRSRHAIGMGRCGSNEHYAMHRLSTMTVIRAEWFGSVPQHAVTELRISWLLLVCSYSSERLSGKSAKLMVPPTASYKIPPSPLPLSSGLPTAAPLCWAWLLPLWIAPLTKQE